MMTIRTFLNEDNRLNVDSDSEADIGYETDLQLTEVDADTDVDEDGDGDENHDNGDLAELFVDNKHYLNYPARFSSGGHSSSTVRIIDRRQWRRWS
jgi:hypothetical protein